MRKQGLIGLLIFTLILIAIMYLLSDNWIESRLESAGSFFNGARVEIDDFDYSIFNLEASWDRLQITNPKNTMKNRIETEKCSFDIEFIPVLSGKIIIENFTILGIKTNTERATDGKIEKKRLEDLGFIGRKIAQLEKEVSSAPAFNIAGYTKKMNIDSIISLLDLKTPEKFENLQRDIATQSKNWKEKLNTLDFEKNLGKLETDIKAIKTDKIESLEEVKKTFDQVDKVKKSISGLEKKVDVIWQDLNTSFSGIKSDVTSVDDWIEEDYKSAMAMAKIPDIDAQNIGKMIFGKQLVNQVNTYLGYAQQARSYSAKLKSSKPEDENPPRLKGQDIYFYNQNAKPDFWIKDMALSGMTDSGINLEGNIKNIVSDQRLIGAMTDFHFNGESDGQRNLKFDGVLNYLEETPSEVFNLTYSNFPLNDIHLADSRLVPNKIESGVGTVNGSLDLKGEKIQSKVEFSGRALNFSDVKLGSSINKAEQIIQDVIRQTDKISFKSIISGEKDDLKFSLRSNLDDLFSRNLKAVVGKEVEKAKAEIRKKVDQEVGKYKKQAENLVKEHEQKLKLQIQKHENQLNEQKKILEKKKEELEKEKKKVQDKIEKEKKKLENKAKDKIKGLF